MTTVDISLTVQQATSASPIPAGYAVTRDPSSGGYVVATTAARAAAGGVVSGVAWSASSTVFPSFQLLVEGDLPPSISGLGAGTVAPVVVSATGALARKASPVSGDVVIGTCYADGTVVVRLAVDQVHAAEAPTGTGFRHVTAGVEDAASKLVENADVHAAAAIAVSKLASGAAGNVLLSTPAYGKITDSHVDAAAAIAGSKIAPSFTAIVSTTAGSYYSIGANVIADFFSGSGTVSIARSFGGTREQYVALSPVQSIICGAPIIGDASITSQYGIHGQTAGIDMLDADYTPSWAEMAMYVLHVTGANAAPRTLMLTACGAVGKSYGKFVINETGQDLIVTDGGLGTSVTIADTFGAPVWISPAGARRLGPDV